MLQFSAAALDHLLQTFGYWAVLVFVLVESIGVPFPGETMLIAASVYAGSTHRLDIALVIAAAATGAILGDNFGYAIGREGGYRVLRRYGRYVRLDDRKLKVGQYLFLKHGGKVVFFGRFVSILRTYAAFLAGVDRMPWRRFVLYNASGGIVWASIYGVGAYAIGKAAAQVAGTVGVAVGIAAAAVVVAALVFLWRNERRLEDMAERELPGPLDERPTHRRDAQTRPTGAAGAGGDLPAPGAATRSPTRRRRGSSRRASRWPRR
jgi:membrane protein DedA with SNARE-associated domain